MAVAPLLRAWLAGTGSKLGPDRREGRCPRGTSGIGPADPQDTDALLLTMWKASPGLMMRSIMPEERSDQYVLVARWLQRSGLIRFLPWQWLRHRIYPLLVRGEHRPYDLGEFWSRWYEDVALDGPDSLTISKRMNPFEARFHYNAVENSILRYAIRRGLPNSARTLDLGAGTGHWTAFALDVLDASTVTACDVSARSAEILEHRFENDARVSVKCLDVAEDELTGPFDLVMAIGVIFHIVDDDKWRRTIARLAQLLAPGGLIMISGQFGSVTADVQFERDEEGTATVNKRIRSRRRWRSALSAEGLRLERVIYTWRDRAVMAPENNVAFIVKAR